MPVGVFRPPIEVEDDRQQVLDLGDFRVANPERLDLAQGRLVAPRAKQGNGLVEFGGGLRGKLQLRHPDQ